MKVVWVGWDVDRNWYSRLAFPKFEYKFHETMKKVAKERYGWPETNYHQIIDQVKAEDPKQLNKVMLDVSTEAQRRVRKCLYMKGGNRLKRMFNTLKKDYNHYIISNAIRPHIDELFDIFEIDPKLFKFILSYQESGFHKPDPQIFRKALKKSHAPNNQHVFIGDDYKMDIEPAKAVGMTTIWSWQEAPKREVDRKPAVDRYAPTIYDVPLIIRKL